MSKVCGCCKQWFNPVKSDSLLEYVLLLTLLDESRLDTACVLSTMLPLGTGIVVQWAKPPFIYLEVIDIVCNSELQGGREEFPWAGSLP